MRSELYLDDMLRRQTVTTQQIQALGYCQRPEYRHFKDIPNLPSIAATAVTVSGIARPHPEYGVPSFQIANSAEPNIHQGPLYTFNENNLIYFNNNNILLSNSIRRYPEQIFSEVKNLQNPSKDCEELFPTFLLAHDAHSLSSSTNLFGVTYASDTRRQFIDDREQGVVPLGRSTNAVTVAWGENVQALPASTRSPKENQHLGQASNSIYSDTNLFVRFLSHSMDEDQLVKLFKPYGKIESRGIKRNIRTGENMGMGFVRFETHEQAKKAMNAMNNPRKPGARHNMIVQWAKREHDNVPTCKDRLRMRKLFVRNIPLDITVTMLENLFLPYGVLESVTLHRDTSAAGQYASNKEERRIAFVTFKSDGVAQKASEAIHNTYPFPSCDRIPLMIKLAEDNPTRLQKHNSHTVSPTNEWLSKKTNVVPIPLTKGTGGGGGPPCEGGESTTAFAFTPPGGLYGPPKINLAEPTKNSPNVMPNGGMNSPLPNPELTFETGDGACTNYSSPMEGPLAYAQIPLPQPLPVPNLTFTFNNPEHSFVQTFAGSTSSSANPNIGTAAVFSSDMISLASVSQPGKIYYSPQSSFMCASTSNRYPTTPGVLPSYPPATINPGNPFPGFGCANTPSTSSLNTFQTLRDPPQLGSRKTSITSQKDDSHGDINSPTLTLSLNQKKNLNEACLRFGEVIERLDHFRGADQESAVLTPNNCLEKPAGGTVERQFSSLLSHDLNPTDVVCCEDRKPSLNMTLISPTSSGMMCFPFYSTLDLLNVPPSNGGDFAAFQTTEEASGVKEDVKTKDWSVGTMWLNEPCPTLAVLDAPHAGQTQDHAKDPSAFIAEDSQKSSRANSL
ncbi:unnamed protein product [Phytomonas sp. Hart1]|nr:unnamed protein product [Phytomonas sp. Hart1]|eukprot:CCW67371.1 unnamed protein product [Phytomonas sp. isolate Hart1]